MALLQWQIVLQRITKLPTERQRLANVLGISSTTLARWINGETHPNTEQLARLIRAVQPTHRYELLEAIEAISPHILSSSRDDSTERIAAAFFVAVLQKRATTSESLRFWQISDMVLQQALAHLDPNQLGMAISLAPCMPPTTDGKICSLRERIGRGTLPWSADLEHDSLFLGIESLAGYVLQTRQERCIQDLRNETFFPATRTEFEVSAAAHPVWQSGRIAGCLVASSTQVDYFSQRRLSLLGVYSNIIALAFHVKDFYSTDIIGLRPMPKPSTQRLVIATFRQRVTQALAKAAREQQPIDNAAIELDVWRELEQMLLSAPDSDFEYKNP